MSQEVTQQRFELGLGLGNLNQLNKYLISQSQSPHCYLVSVVPSKLDFHIWNANSQSFAGAKSEAKMAAYRGQFFRHHFQSLTCK